MIELLLKYPLEKGNLLLRWERNWEKILLLSQKKLRTIVKQSVKGVIIPVPREPAVHIWVKPVDLANTHIMARVKAAHTEIVMSIVLTLLN